MKDGLLDRNDASFPSDLTRLRTEQRLSELELGEMIGRTAQCIRDYESGVTLPQQWTVNGLNNVLVGRNSWGMTVGEAKAIPRVYFDLESVPKDEFAAEAHRRLLSGTGSE